MAWARADIRLALAYSGFPCVDKSELAFADMEMIAAELGCSLLVVSFGYSCCCNSNSIVDCNRADSRLSLRLVADVHTLDGGQLVGH